MATIMTVGDSDGERRCDERCHQALSPRCDCCCEGRYHGVGTSERAQEMLTNDVRRGVLGEQLAKVVTDLFGQVSLAVVRED